MRLAVGFFLLSKVGMRDKFLRKADSRATKAGRCNGNRVLNEGVFRMTIDLWRGCK